MPRPSLKARMAAYDCDWESMTLAQFPIRY
jgi:hypothetical protein